ncbi:hypothetical protein F2Q69_00002575 [Brassica cretica]|uniref:Transcription elongation factor SPT5 n=1 Tax=Brassica cretica TaxID=69181 RepID=A0A8S9NXG2_BRACR|nr:hypothetical protein F2Q69_00002575 [Brassica cretica]
MPRHRGEEDDVDEDYDGMELEEEEEEDEGRSRGGGSRQKRGRSSFFDDYAEEDSEEEEDDDDDEDYGSRRGKGGGGGGGAKRKKSSAAMFVDDIADQVDDDDEEGEDEDGEDGFIVDTGTDLPDERVDRRRYHDRGFDENDEDVDDLERRIQERFSRPQEDYDEEATDVEQQALLPSVRDPKLWMVKCAIGREREVAVCLMQKYIDRGSDLQIRSVVALDHLKNYIYVEADKEAHVKEAIKGMRNIYANQKILLVPIREMTDVLSVESKAIDLSRDTWVRMKIGTYKGDLAKVVDVDNVRQRVTVKDTSRYSMGSETPMHPSRTPLHPYMTPMRDAGATPIHDGMRTPMRDRAWNPYTPMSPPRDNWEEGNPGSWGTSPNYQPGSPPSRAYEAPTPGSGWASTPGGSYSDAGTPRDSGSAYVNAPSPYLPSTPGQPMTPSSASYLPGTPGGQPMTPGTGLDVMSPVIGGDAEAWFMPDILVEIHKVGEDSDVGVIRDVSDGTCKVSLGSSGEGDTIMALPGELEIVPPRKNDRVKIVGGQYRGSIGKLIGIDGSDGIVKIEDNLDVKILDLAILAKFVQP